MQPTKSGPCIAIALIALASIALPAAAEGTRPVGTRPEGTRPEGTRLTLDSLLKRASFAGESASHDVRFIADWVVDSADNQDLPFAIIDKTNARVFVFHADGRVRGTSPVLLGLARGDDSAPGIGEREMKDIPPADRTTPAGRFVVDMGPNFYGKQVVWVDYAGALSMHRVVTNNPKERRLQRLATPTSADNRISYGCINVPVKFFDTVVSPAFGGTKGIVYILPETRVARVTFGAYDVAERAQRRTAIAALRRPSVEPIAITATIAKAD